MLPARKLEIRKYLLTLSLAKLRQKAKEILIIYELFIYGDIHVVKCTLNKRKPSLVVNYIFINFCYSYQHIFIVHDVHKNT
jgi:hypothetical protein